MIRYKTGNYGKTIGNAKLSEEGTKYYQELKSKYSNTDFILVSKDQKASAQEKLKESQKATDSGETVTISADSIEELIQKIKDYQFSARSDEVLTEEETKVGQHIDFRG